MKINCELPGPDDQAAEESVVRVLNDLFEIHRAMMRKLLAQDSFSRLYIAKFLEDVGHRYLDLSEEISIRKPITYKTF